VCEVWCRQNLGGSPSSSRLSEAGDDLMRVRVPRRSGSSADARLAWQGTATSRGRNARHPAARSRCRVVGAVAADRGLRVTADVRAPAVALKLSRGVRSRRPRRPGTPRGAIETFPAPGASSRAVRWSPRRPRSPVRCEIVDRRPLDGTRRGRSAAAVGSPRQCHPRRFGSSVPCRLSVTRIDSGLARAKLPSDAPRLRRTGR
jgi:hypothetical protein